MPPQRVQRMVQYSDPARPVMTRRTLSWPSHSGQVDRTAAGDLVSQSCMGGFPFWLDVHAALVEIVDAGLCIRDRRIGVGPGETDFQFGKRNPVDHHRLQIRPSDPGVPEAGSGLESLDLKAVVIHVAPPAIS